MATLNPFVENNKSRINQFLNSLCEVGDFYDTLEMDQYMALSKKDMNIHITLNELYNTHSLILQHIETLVRFSTSFSFYLTIPHRTNASHRMTNSISVF